MFGKKGKSYVSMKTTTTVDTNINPLFSKYKKKSAAQVFLDKKKGIDESKLSPQEKYQRILDKKINDMRIQSMQKRARFGQVGENSEEKPISRGMEMFIRKQAEKLAQAEHKKLMDKTAFKIKSANLPGMQGGFIDAKGNVYGPDRKIVAKINTKTGKVNAMSGLYICKYKSGGNYSALSQIANFVAKTYHKPAAAPPPAPLWD